MNHRNLLTPKLELLCMPDFASYILHLDQKAARSAQPKKWLFVSFCSSYYHVQKKACTCTCTHILHKLVVYGSLDFQLHC